MKNKLIHRLKDSSFIVPFTLMILCVFAYGLLIPTLGYYWDDWPYAYVNHMFGPRGYPEFVALDRPYSAWIFMGLSALFDENPIGYHISSILFFWMCAVLFWLLLLTLWPRREKQAFWAALIFTVYPGFLGHPNAIIYNHHYIAMALYLFSLIAMVKAIKGGRKAWIWHVPGAFAMLLSQFSIEYFLGWEFVRPVIAWLAFRSKTLKIKRKIRALLPYWIGTLSFLIWRVIFFGFPTYQPLGGGEVDPISRRFLLTTLQEVLDSSILVWERVFPRLNPAPFSREFWLIYLGVILITTAFILLILMKSPRIKNAQSGDEKDGFEIYGSLMAFIGVLTAGLPFWLTGLTVDIEGFASRFTLPFIPWAVLLLVVLLNFLEKSFFKQMPLIIMIVVALIVGGATGSQLWNTNRYRNDWQEVQRYIIQMVHRIPGLEPGTTLVINDLRFLDLYSDNSLTAVVNWTYSPNRVSKDLNYMVYYLSVRLGFGLPTLEPGLPIVQDYRSMAFTGSTDKLLVVYSNLSGCLRVLDEGHPDWLPSSFPEAMIPVLSLSDLSLIDVNAAQAKPPENIFDLEEGNTWCTYFEQADLAAQVGDWEQVAAIGDKAYSLEDDANDLTENLVFIDGYLRSGRIQRAWALSKGVSQTSEGGFDKILCNLWRTVEGESGEAFEMNYDIFCSGN